MSSRAAFACGALVLAPCACRIDQLDRSVSIAETSASLELVQQPETPPPVVLAHAALSEFARDHFVALDVTVRITSGQSLEARGIAPAWLAAETRNPERASFGGPIANELQAHAQLDFAACSSSKACVVTLELAPFGAWAVDVPFPLSYDVSAALSLEPRDRLAVPSDIDLSLELSP